MTNRHHIGLNRVLLAALVVVALALLPATAAAAPAGDAVAGQVDDCQNADAGPSGDAGPPASSGAYYSPSSRTSSPICSGRFRCRTS